MSDSQKASFGKKLASGGMMKLAPIFAGLAIVYCVVVTIFASYYSNLREEQLRPQSILGKLKQGATVFAKKNGRFPQNFVELESAWREKRETGDGSVFPPETRNAFFYLNCSYRYYSDSTGQVASFWIVPKGKYSSQYNTLFVLLANERGGIREEVWKGAPLTDENEILIPERAVPGARELAMLGMNKQKSLKDGETEADKPKKKGFPFPF